jgi:DNA-binding beta-propeller fold protein YncE
MNIIVAVFLLASAAKACDTAGTVTTLAGSGSAAFADGTGANASFYYPTGVAFSPDQTLLAVADPRNNRIRLIVVATGAVSALAGNGSTAFADGTGAAASFSYPSGVAFSPDQTLIAVVDTNNNLVRLIAESVCTKRAWWCV